MYNTKNITFRAYEIDLKQIEKAAKKAGKNVSDYVRDLIIPQAYAATGTERPDLPELKRGRYGGIVAQAARTAGMTPEQFKKEAAENLAQAMLNAQAKGKSPKGEASGVRRGPGAYSSAPGRTSRKSN
jgi:hypothetical protein